MRLVAQSHQKWGGAVTAHSGAYLVERRSGHRRKPVLCTCLSVERRFPSDGERVVEVLSEGACVQAFIVRATQPTVGCVRALGKAKVAQHGSLREGNACGAQPYARLPWGTAERAGSQQPRCQIGAEHLGSFGDPRACACMHASAPKPRLACGR